MVMIIYLILSVVILFIGCLLIRLLMKTRYETEILHIIDYSGPVFIITTVLLSVSCFVYFR